MYHLEWNNSNVNWVIVENRFHRSVSHGISRKTVNHTIRFGKCYCYSWLIGALIARKKIRCASRFNTYDEACSVSVSHISDENVRKTNGLSTDACSGRTTCDMNRTYGFSSVFRRKVSASGYCECSQGSNPGLCRSMFVEAFKIDSLGYEATSSSAWYLNSRICIVRCCFM